MVRKQDFAQAKSPIEQPSTKFAPLDTAPRNRRVATVIETDILGGWLKEGDLLPSETDLAEQLGVHRSTVREGIRSLENSGLVQRTGAKRLRIAVPAPAALARANTRALGLSRVSFDDLWEIQMELEPFGARLAAQRIDSTLIERLDANVAVLEAGLDDHDEVIRNDIDFHRLVAEAAGNLVLSMSLLPISVLLFSATVPLHRRVKQARHRLLSAHRAIVEALNARDVRAAEEWMARHIRDFRVGNEVGGLDMTAAIQLDLRSLDLLTE